MVALLGVETKQALELSERMRTLIASHEIVWEGKKIPVTTSIGIASYPEVCSDKLTFEGLLKEADTALVYAKAHGRNQTACAPIPVAEGERLTL